MQASPSNDATTQLTMHTMIVKRWRCDVCLEASFDDFDDACRHEQTCRGPQALQGSQDTHIDADSTITETVTTAVACMPTRKQSTRNHNRDVYVSPEPSPQQSTVVATRKRTSPNPDSSIQSKSQFQGQRQGQVHTFFAPRKNLNDTTSKSSSNKKHHKSKLPTTIKPSICDFGQIHKQSTSKPIPNQSAKEINNDVDNINTKPAKKARAETIEEKIAILTAVVNADMKKPPLAGIFSKKSMQQLMAEQRQAEFQAQRHLERQKELQRKQKRQASKSVNTTSAPTKPTVAPVHCRQPLAPCVPIHVGTSYSNPSPALDESSFWMNVRTPHAPKLTPAPTQTQQLLVKKRIISSPRTLDASDDQSDLLKNALADIFVPSTHNKEATALWSQKHGHQHNIHSIVGQTTQQAANTLQQWIEDWCFARQRAFSRMKQRHEQLKRKKPAKVLYKQDRDEDSWDDDQLTNVYLLTGPPASGKTGLVHAVARHCKCSVLEINTTTARSASALKNSIQEATQSCSTSDLFRQQSTNNLQTLFQQQTIQLQESDDEASPQKPRPTTSLTVILIDEVDLIYETEGDAGFWTAVTSLAKSARSPIFLTANTIPPNMASIKYNHISLTRPSPLECSDKLLQVCHVEGIAFQSGLSPDTIRERLSWIATVCQCDLRKLLLQLQLYHTTGMITGNKLDSARESPCHNSTAVTVAAAVVPVLYSIVPQSVPADKYTILHIHGDNLHVLFKTRDISVQLGSETCRARIVDKETILVLCPPLRENHKQCLSSRILSLSMSSPIMGRLDGVSTKVDNLVDGSVLQGTKRLSIEYLVDLERTDDDESTGECEWDDSVKSPIRTIATESFPNFQEGLKLWNQTLQEVCATEEPFVSPIINKDNKTLLQQLDDLAAAAHDASDAAYLEDFQRGYPVLSGACRGFAFDLTEEGGSADGGKLTLNDNCRPPSEDRLYSLGWKENCFFYGVAETYMTRPATAQERRSLNTMMERARGEAMPSFDLGWVATTDKNEEIADDLDDIARRDSNGWEEDMFLPQPLSALCESLPHLLRKPHQAVLTNHDWRSNQLLRQRQSERLIFVQTCLSALFDPNFQPAKGKARMISRELLVLNGKVDKAAVTDFFPILCRMGALEESMEAVERESKDSSDDTCRRSSRRNARNSRRHYFDSLSRKLEWDEGDISASDLSQMMIKTLLTYNGDKKKL